MCTCNAIVIMIHWRNFDMEHHDLHIFCCKYRDDTPTLYDEDG
jgi:hypothetical protein